MSEAPPTADRRRRQYTFMAAAGGRHDPGGRSSPGPTPTCPTRCWPSSSAWPSWGRRSSCRGPPRWPSSTSRPAWPSPSWPSSPSSPSTPSTSSSPSTAGRRTRSSASPASRAAQAAAGRESDCALALANMTGANRLLIGLGLDDGGVHRLAPAEEPGPADGRRPARAHPRRGAVLPVGRHRLLAHPPPQGLDHPDRLRRPGEHLRAVHDPDLQGPGRGAPPGGPGRGAWASCPPTSAGRRWSGCSCSPP